MKKNTGTTTSTTSTSGTTTSTTLYETLNNLANPSRDSMYINTNKIGWGGAHTHSLDYFDMYSVDHRVSQYAFDERAFRNKLVEQNMTPDKLLSWASENYAPEAFSECIAYMYTLDALTQQHFDEYVAQGNASSAFLQCPAYHTVDNVYAYAQRHKCPNIIHYVRPDLRDNDALKKSLFKMKLKLEFDEHQDR